MASITIENFDAALEAALRMRAVRHGRSIEDEALDILRIVLSHQSGRLPTFTEELRANIDQDCDETPEIPPREPIRDPPHFGD